MENVTSAAAAMAEPQQEQDENVYETALKNLDQILEAISAGKVPDWVAYLIVNLKKVYVELRKNQLEVEQKHKEFSKELEANHAAVINLSAHNSANSALLTRHDVILEHNRGGKQNNQGLQWHIGE